MELMRLPNYFYIGCIIFYEIKDYKKHQKVMITVLEIYLDLVKQIHFSNVGEIVLTNKTTAIFFSYNSCDSKFSPLHFSNALFWDYYLIFTSLNPKDFCQLPYYKALLNILNFIKQLLIVHGTWDLLGSFLNLNFNLFIKSYSGADVNYFYS